MELRQEKVQIVTKERQLYRRDDGEGWTYNEDSDLIVGLPRHRDLCATADTLRKLSDDL